MNRLKRFARKLAGVGQQASDIALSTDAATIESAYWTGHNVTLHRTFASAADSLAYFKWRNDQYFNYLELMPVTGFDSKAVLDFGCGPGHDLVGFSAMSQPNRLVGADVSSTSLAEARARLAIHGKNVELLQLDPRSSEIPLASGSIDHIHSSGVLHHTPDPLALLKELRRVLRPDGTMNVMIYNYDSVWLHLYVAYVKQILEGLYVGEDIRAAFRHTTDGVDCPISNVYRPDEWIALCNAAGFKGGFSGAAVSLWECSLLGRYRFDACMREELPAESREFLLGLTLDSQGYPVHRGNYAGVDGCFRLSLA